MSGVDEILNYESNPNDDYYALLGCDENSSVSLNLERNSSKLVHYRSTYFLSAY